MAVCGDTQRYARSIYAVISLGLPYSAKFTRAVNFADFANSNLIAKIIFVKITIFDLLRPKLILTCVVNKKPHPAHVKMAVPRALLK